MNIDSILNGVVIDHITAGRALRIFDLLKLNDLDCSVAIINQENRVITKTVYTSLRFND